MCGRFSEVTALRVLAKRFGVPLPSFDWPPRYNLAPGQEALVVIQDTTRRIVRMSWGLVPPWAKDRSIGYKMINARAETIADKPSYRKAFRERRGLVMADGFYEWAAPAGGGRKTPYRIVRASREPFAFAGIWEIWKNPKGPELRSFSIITTRANEKLKAIHERMPVILPAEKEDFWLDAKKTDPEILKQVLSPLPSSDVDFYEVSPIVNSAKNDVETCLQPV